MRKFFLLTLTFTVFSLISCEGPMGPPGRDGRDGKDGSRVNWVEIPVTIDRGMWDKEEDITGPYLYYEIAEPELTRDVLENPTTQMETYYRYRLNEKDTDRYVPLSYSDYWKEKEEYFTVEYSVGQITILYKNSIGTQDTELDTYDFTIRIVWNNI
ncbi:MAG: hypothetical protein LBH12_05375 [Dysgonamonadaceae bacterium]|nr:hypothetical protein [Dysgonamonadaceae bacterium]